MIPVLLMLAVAAPADLARHEALFLDGDCRDYAGLAAETHAVGEGATLHVAETSSELWLCVELPEGAGGMLDLRVESPGLPAAVNLHVSAQLGEWLADAPETAPTSPGSRAWWNQQGWYANWLPLRGFREVDGRERPNFESGGARELVLRKERFGRGDYRLRFELRLHPDPRVVTPFPADRDGAPRQLHLTVS